MTAITFVIAFVFVSTDSSEGAEERGKVGDLWYIFDTDLKEATVVPENQNISTERANNYSSLTEVIVPETVTYNGENYAVVKIEEWTFSDSNITYLFIPTSVKKLGGSSIRNTKLTYLEIPGSVEYLWGNTLGNNLYLEEVKLNEGLKRIDDYSFRDSNIKKLSPLPSTVELIGERAFLNCKNLTEIQLNEGLKTIEGYSFDGSGLKSITIPSTVKSLASNAFRNCTSLEEIILKEGTESIGGYVIGGSKVKSITLPSTVKTLNSSAFYGLFSLETIVLNEGLETIGDRAFCECYRLKEVFIPSTVKSIHHFAFHTYQSDYSIQIIGTTEAHLMKIEVDPNNQFYSSKDGVLFNKDQTILLKYPNGKPDTTYTVPDTVVEIADLAFCRCNQLTEIILPDSVTKISAWHPFFMCANLSKIVFSKNINYVFHDKSKGDWSIALNVNWTYWNGTDYVTFDNTAYNAIANDTSLNETEKASKIAEVFKGKTYVLKDIIYSSSSRFTLNYIEAIDGQDDKYVKYYSNNYSGLELIQPFAKGTEIALYSAPTMWTQYNAETIIGWNTMSDGTGVFYPLGSTTLFSDNVSLYAIWATKPTNAKVILKYNDGDEKTIEKTVKTGIVDLQPFTDEISSLLSSEVVIGWTINSKTVPYNGLYKFVRPLTIEAIQATTPSDININLVNNGEIVALQAYADVDYALKVQPFVVANKSFKGWNTEENGSGTSYSVGDAVKGTGDITLYAQWNDTYTVSFNSNGASGKMDDVLVIVGNEYKIPEPAFSLGGKKFVEWNTAVDGLGTSYDIGAKVSDSILLYAIWEDGEYNIVYRITYELNGGTTSNPSYYTIKYPLNLSSPTKAGSTFIGWYENPEFTEKVTSLPNATLGDKKLYAKFLENMQIGDLWYCFDDSTMEATVIPERGTYATNNNYANLVEVDVPETVEKDSKTYTVVGIGRQAFHNANKLERITLPSTLKILSEYAISYTRIAEIEIPGTVKVMELSCLQHNYELSKIILNEGIEEILYNAIIGSYKIEKIDIPKSVKYIHTFGLHTSLQTDIVYSGGEIGKIIANLKEINVHPDNEYYSSLDGVLFNKDQTVLLKYPEGKLGKVYVVPDTVTEISGTGFSRCHQIEELVISDNVTSITAAHPFIFCAHLTKIYFSSNLSLIDYNAIDAGVNSGVETWPIDLCMEIYCWNGTEYVRFNFEELKLDNPDNYVDLATSMLKGKTFIVVDHINYEERSTRPVLMKFYELRDNQDNTIKYYSNNESGLVVLQPFVSGEEVTLYGEPTAWSKYKPGSVVRWNTLSDGTGTDYPLGSIAAFTEDITLFAIWDTQPPVITLTLEYTVSGSTLTKEIKKPAGLVDLTPLSNMIAEELVGEKVVGWTIEGSTDPVAPNANIEFSEDKKLTATQNPIETVDVILNSNFGDTPEEYTIKVYKDTDYALKTQPFVYPNLIFNEWNTKADGLGTSYKFGSTINIDATTTLYAIWDGAYTITFDPNGAAGHMEIVDVRINNKYTIPDCGYSLGATSFVEWNSSADGNGISYLVGSEIEVKGNMTLYAIWIEGYSSNTEWTITYDYQNGTSYDVKVKDKHYTIALENEFEDLVPDYKYFKEWNTATDGTGIGVKQGEKYSATQDLILYPFYDWIEYTITYHYDGGEPSGNPEKYTYNTETFILLPTSKTGYMFGGWYLEPEFKNKISKISKGNGKNLELYAYFEAKEFKLSFDTNGGSPIHAMTIKCDSPIVAPAPPTKEGFVFKGWNPALPDVMPANDITVVAEWIVEITITFNGNGGEGTMDSITVVSGSEITLSNEFEKEGYKFKCWSTRIDGSGKSYGLGETVSFTEDIELYAQWAAESKSNMPSYLIVVVLVLEAVAIAGIFIYLKRRNQA